LVLKPIEIFFKKRHGIYLRGGFFDKFTVMFIIELSNMSSNKFKNVIKQGNPRKLWTLILVIIVVFLSVSAYYRFNQNASSDITLSDESAQKVIDQLLKNNATEFYLLAKADRDFVVDKIVERKINLDSESLSLLKTTLTDQQVSAIADDLIKRKELESFNNLSKADQNLIIIVITQSGLYPEYSTEDNLSEAESVFGDTGYTGWDM